MHKKYKLLSIIAAGTTLAASFFGIQTYYTTVYTTGAATSQVALSTPIAQSSEIFGGGGVRKY